MIFNDNDPYAAAWLRNLWPDATVDEKSIADLHSKECARHARVHLFAGIGGWEYALALAGWPADAPVWTGSCPCQPFSTAGKRQGDRDPRHLWPEFRRLIAECRPPVVFGEQVASAAGRQWLAGVRADLEELGYAVGAADLCAAGVAAPHLRQRLFWVADAHGGFASDGGVQRGGQHGSRLVGEGHPLTNATVLRLLSQGRDVPRDGEGQRAAREGRVAGGLDDAMRRRHELADETVCTGREPTELSNAWADSIWLPCLDGKARRTQPGLYPLAHGVPARVGRLRAYGNAIVPPLAAIFIKTYMESRQ